MRTLTLRRFATWVTARVEVLVPALGVPILLSMVGSNGGRLSSGQLLLVWSLAVAYAALVVWSPMALPPKQVAPMTRAGVRRAATAVAPTVLCGALVLVVASIATGRFGQGGHTLPSFIPDLALIIVLGSLGVVAERSLPLDLFPVLRHREFRRILYVLVAALFLTALTQIWGHIFGGLARAIGGALGETEPDPAGVTSSFAVGRPLILLWQLLIGAGLFEELLFRVGVMTPVWALTRRWGWGLLASALLFGLYHVTPLSGSAASNAQAPVIAILTSFGMGLANGVVYRYRGFTAAVLVHGLGDWLMLMILAEAVK
jgi:membrane protease YdiL (CAAX protease family)